MITLDKGLLWGQELLQTIRMQPCDPYHLLWLKSVDNEIAIVNATTLETFWNRWNISAFDLEYRVSTHVKVFNVKIKWKYEGNAKQPI